MNIKLLVGALVLASVTTASQADQASVYSSNITEAEVLAAQQAWGDVRALLDQWHGARPG